MINYDEPYWCEEDHPPVRCWGYCPACADPEEYWHNWDEQDWSENKLFYENDLSHLEEMSQRERHPTKEKM